MKRIPWCLFQRMADHGYIVVIRKTGDQIGTVYNTVTGWQAYDKSARPTGTRERTRFGAAQFLGMIAIESAAMRI